MSKEKIQALDQKLSAQRTQWSDTIRGLARGLKKVDGMEQVIAETLSSRQTCVDQIAYLNVKIKEPIKTEEKLKTQKIMRNKVLFLVLVFSFIFIGRY